MASWSLRPLLWRSAAKIFVFFLFLLVQHASLGAGEAVLEILRAIALAQTIFLGDLLLLPIPEQAVVQELHAILGACLDGRSNTKDLVLANQVGDGRRNHQHL